MASAPENRLEELPHTPVGKLTLEWRPTRVQHPHTRTPRQLPCRQHQSCLADPGRSFDENQRTNTLASRLQRTLDPRQLLTALEQRRLIQVGSYRHTPSVTLFSEQCHRALDTIGTVHSEFDDS